MSEAVLISIRPQWCELIASGEKTVEVRKTRPKLDVPFKVYIYCTADANYCPPPTPVYCRKCGTKLKVYYAEKRLYAVKCGYCETVTLVKASHPTEAARFVGEYKEGEDG